MSDSQLKAQLIGRVAGPVVFALMLLLSDWQSAMSPLAWRAAAVSLWMAIWWSTEAVPVAVTALLPLVLMAPLGLADPLDTASAYAHPTIFLFLGGFIIALALERWHLHRRIALAILQRTGTEGRRLIAGFMLVSAGLSMWMTNTSTTMMLLPIGLSVITVMAENVPDASQQDHSNFRIALLLGIAFAASIGGLGTLIGTPPNAMLVAYLAERHGIEISFARWMLVGVPIAIALLPVAWWLLTSRLFPINLSPSAAVSKHLADMRTAQGPMSVAEKRVAIIFALMVGCWMLRRPIQIWFGLPGVNDTTVAMAAAIATFLIPNGTTDKGMLMRWEETSRLPWGVLILFGGGLSLAAVVNSSGLAAWLGESLAPINALGIGVLILAAITMTIYLTEFTSNVATTATLLPVMGAIALQANLGPLLLTVPVTLAASCAFMLPVATAPNAIVFSTGMINIGQMVRAGLWLNILAIGMIWLIGIFVAPALL